MIFLFANMADIIAFETTYCKNINRNFIKNLDKPSVFTI